MTRHCADSVLGNSLLLLVLCFSVSLNASAADENSIQSCDSLGGPDYICGLGIPEDMVIVPGTDWVVAGSYGEGDNTALYLVHAGTKNASSLYAPGIANNRLDRNRYAGCPGAPDLTDFSTHGLGIQTEVNNAAVYNLYAVSHGAREAIEIFELDASAAMPELTWIGCVLMPEGLDANDVSAMRDGTILATVLMHPGFGFEDLLSGTPTGGVYKWMPGSAGFEMLEGSELPGNNGIQVSKDESEIFVAASGLSAVVTLANTNPTRELRRTRTMGFAPDNVAYDGNGYLLTAGMRDDEPTCVGSGPPPASSCPRGSIVAIIHPETMQDRVILETAPSPQFSGATMAIIPGGLEVWVGSFITAHIAYQLLDSFE